MLISIKDIILLAKSISLFPRYNQHRHEWVHLL